ncbi:MAG: hypothetical protein LLG20_15515 [Acidobacteriales bacterium]|nr:hypothetical protein [Terriglobales bacterium]
MAKNAKADALSLGRILASPDIKKAAEDFQPQVQVTEIRKIVALVEDRIALIEGRGEAAATSIRLLSGNPVLQKCGFRRMPIAVPK